MILERKKERKKEQIRKGINNIYNLSKFCTFNIMFFLK